MWESRGPGYNSDTYISMIRSKDEQEADGSRDRNPRSDSHVHRRSFSQEPMTHNDGLSTSSGSIEGIKEQLTVSEQRAHRQLERETGRMWRGFWIRILKQRGYTNLTIAKTLDISESSVRAHLKAN